MRDLATTLTPIPHDGSRAIDLEDVEARCDRALRSNPQNAVALYNLAVVRFAKRDLVAALDLVSKCIDIDPTVPKAFFQRGTVRHAMGDLAGALADFDAALLVRPDDAEVLLSRGATLSTLGNPREALESYTRAIALAPEDARPCVNRGLLRSDWDPVGALEDFEEALRRNPRDPAALFGRGFLLRAKGMRKEALADFVASLECGGDKHDWAPQVAMWIREIENENADGTPGTPLSDLIAAHGEQRTQESYARFLRALRSADLGVTADGVPPGAVGVVASTPDRPTSVGTCSTADGRFVLAFADPPAFVRNFGRRFNAIMSGDALLETALHNSDCRGVRINSAKAEVSIVIEREAVAELLGRLNAPAHRSAKPWWKFW